MIDFHSHILPNLDDGAKSVEETFTLIKEAEDAGFDGIVCTTHYMDNAYTAEEPERLTWINAIQENLGKMGCNVKLYFGNEIYISEHLIDFLKEHKASTINGTSYVLFELPMQNKVLYLQDLVYKMISNGLVPIIAHPERYDFVQKDPNMVADLISMGVLFQANYGSVIGLYGSKAKDTVIKLLKGNMIHFLGSDVHMKNSIYLKMPKILKELENLIGKEKLKEFSTTNPELALKNLRIDIDSPIKIKRRKFKIFS